MACGSSRYLAPQLVPSSLSYADKIQIRKEHGLQRATWQTEPEDYDIRGLDELLELLPTLDAEEAKTRSSLLWESLIDLEGRGLAPFTGSYRWGYSHDNKVARFNAAFVRTLLETSWVYFDGELLPPSLVLFESLGWKANSFLQSTINFKPPLIDQLAKEAGIDPAVLDMLRRDPQIVAELLTRLSNVVNLPKEEVSVGEEAEASNGDDIYAESQDLYGEDMPDIQPGTIDPDGGDGPKYVGGIGGSGEANGASQGARGASSRSSTGQSGSRPFISYVGVHADDDDRDSDGLDQVRRMQIEAQALNYIIELEPTLRRTPDGNPGFDLYEVNSIGVEVRWIEVKAMTDSLEVRPVGLSHRQFDLAREKKQAYWLYIVEYALDANKRRILKIQNPFAMARTFTFDRGWSQIAISEPQRP